MRCCAAAICVRRRWKGRASFRAAAAFWTFSPRVSAAGARGVLGRRCGLHGLFSTPRASGALSRWTAAASCRRRRPCRRCIRAAAPHWAKKLQKLAGRAAAKKDSDTAQKLAEALRADGEKLCADCVLPAADRYMGFVYDTFATALDYLAPEAAVLIDQ